ncbi:MAG: ATP-binding protein [Omnitrophica WOR_2 bacterium]
MEREQLEQAIAALEEQRLALGDTVVEAALASLKDKLASISQAPAPAMVEPGMASADRTSRLSGERRVVTVLFCDVKGSTAMAEKLDPEEWAGIINQAYEHLIGPVRRHGGTVAQVMGDGILAFFGAPLAHEDDPQRAIFAGLEILEGIRGFHTQIKRERSLDFNVRVGIHTGLAVVGEVGTDQQLEYTAIGDTVNLAARMEQTAQPGTVQISAETYKFIEQIFECEPLGDIKVKGKTKPVRTYRVTGLRSEPSPLRGLERQGLQSPLVGREAELRAAQECIRRLFAGQGGIINIYGEAGIGKSRLLAEMYRDVPEDHRYWLEGHTLSYGQTISYWPFQEILRCFADITDTDREDQAWHKLEGKIAALFPETDAGAALEPPAQPSPTTAEILPYLASLLKLKVAGEYADRVKYLDGEAMRKQIFLASRRFFERLARNRPLVLVFEDLHWIDESSVSLLEHLLPLVESVPLLIICLSRSLTETPAAPLGEIFAQKYSARYVEVELAPLSLGDSNQLVNNLLAIENLPVQVHEMIVDKAEGNPFFLEEILRALIDLGAIRRDPITGRWQATAQIENLTIPDTVQGVILARLDRLEEEVKQVLRLASVVGRSFLYRVLRAIAEVGERLDEELVKLQTSELIQEKQRLPELEYLFKHALAQEATYESILLLKRRELHIRVGKAIETLFADRLEEFYSLLAHHYAKAEAWEQAQAYLMKAADQAGRMAADAEALAHYQQAKAAYARAFGEKWDLVERAALERKMGEAYLRRGEFNEALKYFYQALADLGHPAPQSDRAMRITFLKEAAGQMIHSLLPGLFRKHRPGPAAEEELRVYQAIENSIGAGNPELFLMVAFRMLNFSERNDLPAGIAMGSAGLGILFFTLNVPRLAMRYFQRAIKLSEQLQRSDVLGLAPTYLMVMEAAQGNWEEAKKYQQRAADIFHEIGNLGVWWVSMSAAGVLSIWQGDFSRAFAFGNELAQFSNDAADPLMKGDALGLWGFTEQRMGQLEEAFLHLKQAVEVTELAGNVYFRLLSGNELGECYLRMGVWQSALDTLESNRKFINSHHFNRDPQSNSGLYNGFAWAYLLAAEQSDPKEKDAWLKKAGSACRQALKWGNAFHLGKPVAMRLQGRYMWLTGDAVQAKRWWDQSLAEAEALRTPYELGLTHLEISQRLSDRDHLEKAESIFAGLGAELDLRRSRELLTGL